MFRRFGHPFSYMSMCIRRSMITYHETILENKFDVKYNRNDTNTTIGQTITGDRAINSCFRTGNLSDIASGDWGRRCSRRTEAHKRGGLRYR